MLVVHNIYTQIFIPERRRHWRHWLNFSPKSPKHMRWLFSLICKTDAEYNKQSRSSFQSRLSSQWDIALQARPYGKQFSRSCIRSAWCTGCSPKSSTYDWMVWIVLWTTPFLNAIGWLMSSASRPAVVCFISHFRRSSMKRAVMRPDRLIHGMAIIKPDERKLKLETHGSVMAFSRRWENPP